MKYRRQHPIKILSYATRNFWLLSIPLIRGLIYLRFDFEAWVAGAWFDILIVFCMLLLAFIRWGTKFYRYTNEAFYVRTGVASKIEKEVLYRSFSSVEVERKFWLRPFKAAILRIDTNSGSSKKSDLALTLQLKDLNVFIEVYSYTQHSHKLKLCYYPKKTHLVFFSLIFSNTLSGVILLSTLIFQGGKIIGNELEQRFVDTFNSYTRKLTQNISPTALAVSLVILGGWLISFCINLLRHWNFCCERKGSKIVVRSGFLTKRTSYLSSKRINYADLRQSLMSIIFRVSSVHVHCTGYGKVKHAIAVLVPFTDRQEVFTTLKMLLPDYPTIKTTVKPTTFQFRRFIFFPVVFILVIAIVGLTMLNFFPTWDNMIFFVCIIAIIPFIWLLIVKFVSTYTTGIGYAEGFIALKYCHFFEFHTVIVPVDKITMVEIRQSLAQKPTDNCTLVIYTNAEKTKSHIVRFLTYSDTIGFLQQNSINFLK